METVSGKEGVNRRTFFARFTEYMNARYAFVLVFIQMISVGYPLLIISFFEISAPLVRMLFLSHLLPLNELGFATILITTGSFLELATDIAIARFIYSIGKEEFEEALAVAHAISILRGVIICIITFIIAPIIATALSLGADWGSFALLAPLSLLRSFEHLSPRVAERDFRYWAQLKMGAIVYVSSLLALIVVAATTHSHLAVIASLYAQALATVFASQKLADEPFRVKFRSPLLIKAVKFAYPLLINGTGLAISMTGDRFIVAALFNLQTVAIYSVALLATTVPISLIGRVVGTTFLARFYHAGSQLERQVRLASASMAAIAAMYCGAVVFFANPAIGLVFGHQFQINQLAMNLLGLSACVKIVRGDPFTAFMLTEGRTKRLAISNLSVSSGLIYMVLASFIDRSFESILAARLLGEATSLGVTFYLARRVSSGGRAVFSWSTIVAFGFAVVACVGSDLLSRGGGSLVATSIGFLLYGAVVSLWGGLALRQALRSKRRDSGESLVQSHPTLDLTNGRSAAAAERECQ